MEEQFCAEQRMELSAGSKLFKKNEFQSGLLVPAAMARACAADEAGDNVACKEALAEVERVFGA